VTPEIVKPIPAGAPLPEVNYPSKFLPPNSNTPMENPGPSVTGAKPLDPAPGTIPVESLVKSMKPEEPLNIDGMGSSAGAYTSTTQTSSPTSAPQQ
jgi:pilus assembly protein CpaC